MPLINGALQIGRNAIMTSQAALQVVGNNMANAATPSYSRQDAMLAPTQFTEVIPGRYTGTGVTITDVRRMADDALNGRIRTAVSERTSFDVQQQALIRAEATFNELTTVDLSSRLSQFFSSWERLQTEPANTTMRSNVLIEGESLANFIRETREDLFTIQQDLDEQVEFHVAEADTLASKIAFLNQQIVTTESGRAGSSAALRDQRDDLLKQLSELVSIRTRETASGAITVYINNDPLVENSNSRGLEFVEEVDADGNFISQMVFKDTQGRIETSAGRIHGLLTSRDTHITGLMNKLDGWTQSLILEVNQLHAQGQSQQQFTDVTSYFHVSDPAGALGDQTATGLPWAITNGVFSINVYDSDGALVRTEQIKVDVGVSGTDSTLNSIVAAINAQVPELTASVDSTDRLNITTNSSSNTFGFSGPSDASSASNFLAAIGINTYWQGRDATDIMVKSDLSEASVAAGSDGATTNGDVAGMIAELASMGVNSLNGSSLPDHFTAMMGRLGADSKGAQDNFVAADTVQQTLEAERNSISGVSMDEEAVNLITFQRLMQGSSRYVGVINQMMDEVIALAG